MRWMLLALLALGLGGCLHAGADGGSVTRTVTVQVPGGDPSGGGGGEAVSIDEDRCPGAGDQPDGGNLESIAEATLCLINHQREQEGVPQLRDSRLLAGAAQRKARHMVDERYFAHVGPDDRDVRDWVRGTGYLPDGGHALGENIAWGGRGGASPARIVEGWMNSPSHRRNILNAEFEDSGIGVVAGVPTDAAEAGATYAHFFGSQDPPG